MEGLSLYPIGLSEKSLSLVEVVPNAFGVGESVEALVIPVLAAVVDDSPEAFGDVFVLADVDHVDVDQGVKPDVLGVVLLDEYVEELADQLRQLFLVHLARIGVPVFEDTLLLS